jgi:hypothetical protein
MFKGYVDESGMERNRSVVLGGIVGRKEECDLAAKEWVSALYNAGITLPFHSVEFWNRTDGKMHRPYAHLSVSDANLLAHLLTEIITTPPLKPIGVAFGVELFMQLSQDERRWLTTNKRFGKDWPTQGAPTKPYFFVFQACTQVATKEVPAGEKIYFVFDRQDEFADRARILYDETLALQNEFTKRMGEAIVFTSKTEAVMLQAADFVAYLTRWYAEDCRSMNETALECFTKMAKPTESKILMIAQENLDEVLQRCPFRKTFWKGLTKPDFVEQMRMGGHNIVAYKFGNEYHSHHIRPEKVRVIGKLKKTERGDGSAEFSFERSQDEDRGR